MLTMAHNMKNHSIALRFMSVTLVLGASITSAYAGPLLRWVDENGRVNYSYDIPSQLKTTGHVELSPTGYVVKQIAPNKTPQQIAEEKYLKDQATARRLADDQLRIEDSGLLGTYESLEQLDEFYNVRIDLVRDRRKLLEAFKPKLNKEIEVSEQQLAKTPSESNKKKLQELIAEKKKELEIYAAAIQQNFEEEYKMQTEFMQRRERLDFLLKQREARLAEKTREKDEVEKAYQELLRKK